MGQVTVLDLQSEDVVQDALQTGYAGFIHQVGATEYSLVLTNNEDAVKHLEDGDNLLSDMDSDYIVTKYYEGYEGQLTLPSGIAVEVVQ